jgi:predicted RNA-binding Zn-ribbon protein involved in translation (DUF1610 family)
MIMIMKIESEERSFYRDPILSSALLWSEATPCVRCRLGNLHRSACLNRFECPDSGARWAARYVAARAAGTPYYTSWCEGTYG